MKGSKGLLIPRRGIVAIAAVIGTACMGLTAVALGGAGHGAYGPLELTFGPLTWYCVFLWPVLVISANARSRGWGDHQDRRPGSDAGFSGTAAKLAGRV